MISSVHDIFLNEAFKEAKKAETKDEVPIGAVIVYENKIISRAHNLREKKQQVLTHAELLAVEKAAKRLKSWRLEDCDLYVTLEPCAMCAAALWQARIRNVYYGAEDRKAGAITLGFNLHNHPKLNHHYGVRYIASSKCSDILSEFFKKKRKTKKSK